MLDPPHPLQWLRRRPCVHFPGLRRAAASLTPAVTPASALCIWFSSMSIAASEISCGTLHAQCSASRLSLQYHLSAVGSCATRRHLLQLSHDTQLLNAGSLLTSCTDLACLLAVTVPSLSRKHFGRHLVRDAIAAANSPSGCLGAAISCDPRRHPILPIGSVNVFSRFFYPGQRDQDSVVMLCVCQLTNKPRTPTWTPAPANHWPPSQSLQIQIVLIYTTFKSFLFCAIYAIVSQQ